MYKNILVATDGTRLSGKAVAHAIALAKALGARLTAFYASPDYPLPMYAEGAIIEPMSRREYAAICKEASRQDPRRDRGQSEDGTGCIRRRACGRLDAMARDSRRCPQASQRCDRDGVARSPRCLGHAAGQRDAKSADALESPGHRRALEPLPSGAYSVGHPPPKARSHRAFHVKCVVCKKPGQPMHVSRFFLSTLKEAPAEAELASHRLMLRSGMIKRVSAGIYTWMPLGLRVLRKVETVVREEMNRAGAIELLMPVIQPAELWQESGRWDKYGPELLRLKDRHQRDFVMQPTSEEVITDIARKDLKSYRQLPLNLYHIQVKFRDEVRPRFGVMRSREFIMKDAYSFDVDTAGMLQSYRLMYDAYARIFTRLGLQFRAVAADTGADRRQRVGRVPGACRFGRGRDRLVPGFRLRGQSRARRSGRAACPSRGTRRADAEGRHAGHVDLRGRRRVIGAAAGAHGEMHHAPRRREGAYAVAARRSQPERGQGRQARPGSRDSAGRAKRRSRRRPAARPATSARGNRRRHAADRRSHRRRDERLRLRRQ